MADVCNPGACPVCGSIDTAFFAEAHDVEYHTSAEVFVYRSCGRCDAVYLDPPPVDRLAEIYPPTYYSFQDRANSPSIVTRVKEGLDRRVFRRLLTAVPGDQLSVLDVGGGSGWLLTLLRDVDRRVVETHEVDLDETARIPAEAAGHVFHLRRVEDLSLDRRFDLIVMLNLIEHVEDPAKVLRAMRDLLTPTGRLLLKTPNTDTWDRRLFRHRNWGGFHAPRHWVLFTMPGLQRLAAGCGLACESASYTQGGHQWAASVLGALADRGLIVLSEDRPLHTHGLYAPVAAAFAALDFLRAQWVPTAQMYLTLRRVP